MRTHIHARTKQNKTHTHTCTHTHTHINACTHIQACACQPRDCHRPGLQPHRGRGGPRVLPVSCCGCCMMTCGHIACAQPASVSCPPCSLAAFQPPSHQNSDRMTLAHHKSPVTSLPPPFAAVRRSNWTGNRVTCRDWFQLTLKEGLTVFRDQVGPCTCWVWLWGRAPRAGSGREAVSLRWVWLWGRAPSVGFGGALHFAWVWHQVGLHRLA